MKNKMRAGGLILGTVFALSFFNFTTAAETASPPAVPTPEEFSRMVENAASTGNVAVVATVNMYDAKIDSQENNNLKLSFGLSNRQIVQPDVRYAVQLIAQGEKSQTLVDEKIYSEVLSLGENQTVEKQIEYSAPNYLKGKFQVYIIAKNQNGLSLAIGNPGEVTLNGDEQYIEIVSQTCNLKVEGEVGNKTYFPTQGVDIKNDEKLIATCDIINHSKNEITFTPQIKTFWRTTFGEAVKDNGEAQPTLTLAPAQKKSLYFTLPKAEKPQAYDAVAELVNTDGKAISNKVVFHYVLRGASATIQNLRLDKDYYQKGDTAKASLFWSPSADSFPNSRLGVTDIGKVFASIIIKDGEGKSCANSFKQELDATKTTPDFNISITQNCVNPKIGISIQDEKGNILDEKDYALTSDASKISQAKTEQQKEAAKSALTYGVIFVIILTIISLVIIAIKKRKIPTAAILVILAGGLFLSGGEAKADTLSVSDGSGKYINGNWTWTFSLQGGNLGNDGVIEYNPRENIKIISSILVNTGCSNPFYATANFYGWVDTNLNSEDDAGEVKLIMPAGTYHGGYSGVWGANFTAPSVSGEYLARIFSEEVYTNCYTDNDFTTRCDSPTYGKPVLVGSIPYRVIGTEAACGSAGLGCEVGCGPFADTPPADQLCAVGAVITDPTLDPATNKWTWVCVSGSQLEPQTVSCSADKTSEFSCPSGEPDPNSKPCYDMGTKLTQAFSVNTLVPYCKTGVEARCDYVCKDEDGFYYDPKTKSCIEKDEPCTSTCMDYGATCSYPKDYGKIIPNTCKKSCPPYDSCTPCGTTQCDAYSSNANWREVAP